MCILFYHKQFSLELSVFNTHLNGIYEECGNSIMREIHWQIQCCHKEPGTHFQLHVMIQCELIFFSKEKKKET